MVPALLLLTTVVAAMTGITVSRLAQHLAERGQRKRRAFTIVENYDADIAGMTGGPGRTRYYARGRKKQKNALTALASACGRTSGTANSTP